MRRAIVGCSSGKEGILRKGFGEKLKRFVNEDKIGGS